MFIDIFKKKRSNKNMHTIQYCCSSTDKAQLIDKIMAVDMKKEMKRKN